MAERDDGFEPPALSAKRVAAGVLVAIGIVAPLLIFTYARDEPRLGGWPFFYWYQMLWVFISAGLTGGAYFLMRADERDRRSRAGGRSGGEA